MRRRYFVDHKFQWTIVAYSFAISLLTTIANLTISRFEAFEQLRTQDGMGGSWTGTHIFAVAVLAFLYGSLFLIAVLFSNRLAGPLYRLRKHMEDVTAKKTGKTVHFRKDDYFSELNGAYNKMIESLPSIRKDGDQGFSLLELMAALGIAMALAMVATVAFTGRTQATVQFRQDIDRLQGILMTARNSAMSKNECAIVTRVNATTLQVNTYPTGFPCTGVLPPTDFQTTQTFTGGTTVGNFSSGATLAFRPGGGLTIAQPVTIRISQGTLSNLFTVYSAIGQVRHQ